MPPSSRSEARALTPQALRSWELPVPDGGKAARGTVLVVGGSRATPGAVLLAGLAALRAGAGVLQLAVAESTATALSIAVPEALVLGLPETPDGSVAGEAPDRLRELAGSAQAVLVGPGLDDVAETGDLLADVLDCHRRGPGDAGGTDTSGGAGSSAGGAGPAGTPVVLDAYALGALSRRPELARAHPGPLVLTPNTREAAILLGLDPAETAPAAPTTGPDAGPGGYAAEIAGRYGAVVSLHGHIAEPGGGRWIDENGDAGLGTSGSGDVLAGLVAGLLARGAAPDQAACWATHVHGAAGQRLIPRYGRLGFLARELLDEAPRVLAELSG